MEKRIELEKRGREPAEIKELVLDGCKSTQIVGLTDEYTNLETLSLTNVGLTSLKGFPKFPSLRKLDLSENRIPGGLNHLTGCEKLSSINLSANKIASLDALEPLKELSNLKHLDLAGCGISADAKYREDVFAMFPGLAYLDGLDQNEDEFEESDEENGESSKFADGESDIDEEEDDDDEEEDEEEEGEVGLAYLQNSIDEESEGEDYEPGDANDSDVEIDEEDDKGTPRGQKRKLESED